MSDASDDLLDDLDIRSEDIAEKEMERCLRIYFHRNVEGYLDNWKHPEWMTFSGLKMMLGLPWMLYRKIYVVAIIIAFIYASTGGLINKFAIIPIFSWIYLAFEYPLMNTYELTINIAATVWIMLICGWMNGAIYVRYSKRIIQRMKSKLSDEDFEKQLILKGGVEGVLPSVVILGMVMMLLSSISTGMNPILIF